MFPQGQRTSFVFGAPMTKVGKIMLIGYSAIYVVELLCEHWLAMPVYDWFALNPINSPGFRIWQVITHPLLHAPDAPIPFLLSCLVFYFFAGTLEYSLGTRRFITLYILAAVGGVAAGLPFSALPSFSFLFSGMTPSLSALIVVFGLLQPDATILLFFILPIKAKYLSYGVVVIAVLTFLAKANVHGAYHLGGMLFGYLYFRPPLQLLNANWWRWKYFEISQKRRRNRFTVIDGNRSGRNKNNDNDTPTIH